jgi:uncharacterized membrane protein YvbJ
MPTCPQCGVTVAQETMNCDNCNALINAASDQTKTTELSNVELNARLEKALRRTELLSYAAAGLGLAIFAVIIIISFL